MLALRAVVMAGPRDESGIAVEAGPLEPHAARRASATTDGVTRRRLAIEGRRRGPRRS